MPKYSPSGLSLLKQQGWGKNKTDPDKTNAYLTKETQKSLEGTQPPEYDITFASYKGGNYTINYKGEVKGLERKVMKYIFYKNKVGPQIRIRRRRKKHDENEVKDEYYEINILKLMRKIFWPYITWYDQTKEHPDAYKLIPKDGDQNNLSVQNLEFISKEEYNKRGTKKEILEALIKANPWKTSQEIAKETWYSIPHINKIKNKIKWTIREELQKQRQETWINITQEQLPIYQALINTKGEISNLEIAKKLRPEAVEKAKTNEEKRILTNKISRARKKLIDKRVISRFNDNFEKKKPEAIALLKEREKTHKEIAEQLEVSKHQIDYLAKKQKKQG